MSDRVDLRPRERLVLTAAAQREADARSVAGGVSSDDLMESAGRSAADWILERLAPSRVVILVGPGGNGGDGLVVARRLREVGVDVRTFLLESPDRLGEPSRTMLERLDEMGDGTICLGGEARGEIEGAFEWADWVVDGLLGSGVERPLCGTYLDIVERLNAADVRVVSLDLPSGLTADRGERLGVAVEADITLAMAFLKPAHLLFPASECCGNVAVVPIAYPPGALAGIEPCARVPERAGIAGRLPSRRPDGHKRTFGRVLIVAGSMGMTGAAILCCRAALRAGTGLVYLGIPRSLNAIVETALPEVITLPLPDEGGHLVSVEDVRFIRALENADILAIGPGLSLEPGVGDVTRDLIARFRGLIVVDADALDALRGHADSLTCLGGRSVLTPHPGEFGGLVGRSPIEIDVDRVEAARGFAQEHEVVLLLKGRPSVIGLPDGSVHVNPTGNTGLATGGSGDVLTGLIAGFAAGGASLEDAAVLGAYVHGWAAEVYARDRSERSLTPSDLIELLPNVLREVETWI